MLLRLITYSVISKLFMLFCMLFVNWWAPLFANAGGWLPNWLAWVQTFDDTLDAGQRDGKYSPNMPRYLARVMWLYRNPTYGFDYWVLGMAFSGDEWFVVEYTDTEDKFKFYAVGPNGAFNYHAIIGPFRFKFGWKAWNMFDIKTLQWKKVPWGPQWRIPFVLSISLA